MLRAITNYIKSLSNIFGDWVTNAVLVLLALFTPIYPMMAAAGTLIVVDLLTGVLAARKRSEPISSAGFRRTVAKMLTFQAAIITGFIAETWLLGGLIPISKIVAAAIGLTEIKSIIENLDVLHGSPIFESILKKLHSTNDTKKPK